MKSPAFLDDDAAGRDCHPLPAASFQDDLASDKVNQIARDAMFALAPSRADGLASRLSNPAA